MRRLVKKSRSKFGPLEIRRVSVERIRILSEIARAENRSANGRPNWLNLHVDDIREAVIKVFGPDVPGVSRCIVTLLMEYREARYFTLDISDNELRSIPVAKGRELAELTVWLLDLANHVAVDEEY